MSNLEQGLADFKIELSQEWRMLQTHKWRQPKWMKIPRSMLEDLRWVKLSPDAAKAMISILLIAGETQDNSLPEPELLYLRFRAMGQCWYRTKFSALIDELIQCGFILKTTPELQSYRKKERTSVADAPDAQTVDTVDKKEEEAEEERKEERPKAEPSPTPSSYGPDDVGLVAEAVAYIGRADTRAIVGFFRSNPHRGDLDAASINRILWDYAPPGLRPGGKPLGEATLTAWINSLADHPASIDEQVIVAAQRERLNDLSKRLAVFAPTRVDA